MTPTPGTYAHVLFKGMRTLAYIVSVSPTFTVTYRSVSRRVWKGKATWVRRTCSLVDVMNSIPERIDIDRAIVAAGSPISPPTPGATQ